MYYFLWPSPTDPLQCAPCSLAMHSKSVFSIITSFSPSSLFTAAYSRLRIMKLIHVPVRLTIPPDQQIILPRLRRRIAIQQLTRRQALIDVPLLLWSQVFRVRFGTLVGKHGRVGWVVQWCACGRRFVGDDVLEGLGRGLDGLDRVHGFVLGNGHVCELSGRSCGISVWWFLLVRNSIL